VKQIYKMFAKRERPSERKRHGPSYRERKTKRQTDIIKLERKTE